MRLIDLISGDIAWRLADTTFPCSHVLKSTLGICFRSPATRLQDSCYEVRLTSRS